MPDFSDDPAWCDAYRAGRRDALERVYRVYVRQVERYLRSLARIHSSPDLGQTCAVADFLQEVFARAFSPSARRNYDGRRDFGAYVMAIARNCFIDALRTRGREVRHTLDEMLISAEEGTTPVDDDLDPRVRTVLVSYVAGLKPELKQVYLLRFADCRSQDDACAALGLSRRTLRTRESHLHKGLRRALVRAGVSLTELGRSTAATQPPLRANPPPTRLQP